MIILAIFQSGCTTLTISGTATGIAIIHDRRSPGTVIDDHATSWKIKEAIHKDRELSDPSHINVTVYNNVILLTGEAPSEDLKLRANAIAAKVSGNKKVYNELIIASPTPLTTRASDTYITMKVKTGLLSINDVPTFDPTRVKVVTEDSVVFLIGLVTTQEADAVTEKVRNTSGVKKVVRLFEYISL